MAALPVDEEVGIWQSLAPRDKHGVSGMVHLRIKYSFTIEEEEKSDGMKSIEMTRREGVEEGEDETRIIANVWSLIVRLKTFAVPLSPTCPIPPIIKRAMGFLEENGLDVEGLFRLSANSIEMNEMRRSIDQGIHPSLLPLPPPLFCLFLTRM